MKAQDIIFINTICEKRDRDASTGYERTTHKAPFSNAEDIIQQLENMGYVTEYYISSNHWLSSLTVTIYDKYYEQVIEDFGHSMESIFEVTL